MDSCRGPGKRVRSRSPSPPSSPPPPRGLDPVLGLILDLAPAHRRRRVRAGLHRPLHNSLISQRMSSPLSGMRRPSTWVSPPWVIALHWITSSSLRRTSWTRLRQPPLRSPSSLHQGRLRRPHRCTPGWAHPQTPWLIQPESLCVLGGSHGSPRTSGSLARWSLCLSFRPWPRF